jgi:hypothetical protein
LLFLLVIFSRTAAILVLLLSEADFFVDGKDLQTFVSATSKSRFFFVFGSQAAPGWASSIARRSPKSCSGGSVQSSMM